MGRISKISEANLNHRVMKMLAIRDSYMKDIENCHIKVQKGNTKTGKDCWTISLIPIADCHNCEQCRQDCYDLRNVCFQPAVQNDRAKNSALHKADRSRYWNEILTQIRTHNILFLRLNVGGDLDKEDFSYIEAIADVCKDTSILFFTKNYKGINEFLSKHTFPKNVHPIMSAWNGMQMDNPHNLPCSHVLWEDGTTTAPDYGAYYCGGNCSDCAHNGEGCWTLKHGEHVIFKAH